MVSSTETEQSKNSTSHRRRRNFRRRGRGYHRQVEYKTCPICGKSVKSMLTAVAVNENMDPAHFDCVLKKISEEETIGPGEKVTYIGNGTFAVVKIKPGSKGSSFTIIKRIQYESKDTKADWRKKISRRLRK